MKKLIPLLLILASPLAHAAGKATVVSVSLPRSAKLLFQVQGSSSITGASSEGTAVQQAKDEGILRMQQRIEGSRDSYMDSDPINVEYQCQGVYRVWSIADVKESHYSLNDGLFHMPSQQGAAYYTASVTANIYCDPRDFQQKVAISAMQACEKEPKPECMSKEYMEAFAKIQKTTYQDIYKK